MLRVLRPALVWAPTLPSVSRQHWHVGTWCGFVCPEKAFAHTSFAFHREGQLCLALLPAQSPRNWLPPGGEELQEDP